MSREKELKTAIDAAVEAGEIQLGRYGSGAMLNIERKDDRSPVTDIDKRCEAKVIEVISSVFPDDGFLGEETGESGSKARRWIIDPIDGTRPFIRGIPTHSVLIALEEEGVPTVGVIHLPAMGITCYASKGGGAFVNDEKIGVSSTGKLSDAMGCALGIVEYAGEPLGRGLIEFMRSLDYVYGFMDAYSYVLLASGKIDVCVNVLDKAWDCAAAACIVSEAGGKFSAINGEQTVHGGSIVLTNGVLHEETLRFFKNG
jgi:histidinol phosphatase-like enzyme (inositol monophosphatase family)